PMLLEYYPTHAAFAKATFDEVLSRLPAKGSVAQVNVLDTLVFLNRGDHLMAVPLPSEAQFAPVFGIVVADADGDGHEDLFLAQNFFALRPEWPRLDAGRGLWLRGTGKGEFRPVSGQHSGVAVYGEQRGAAIGDFDCDGCWDLAVTQNGAQTCVFKNATGRQGLRVRVAGPPGNPDGIGTVVRLGNGKTWGPARLISGGSGYWSQNSTVQLFRPTKSGDRLHLIFPGGRSLEVAIPADSTEVIVDERGLVKAVRSRGG
ncbi:MAG: VCBS repeat-containing protein, partial [Verrucomicrobiae bacterium]|nr:VCBS repeat-containing protein [Verrucomicrobiae bacterium]